MLGQLSFVVFCIHIPKVLVHKVPVPRTYVSLHKHLILNSDEVIKPNAEHLCRPSSSYVDRTPILANAQKLIANDEMF